MESCSLGAQAPSHRAAIYTLQEQQPFCYKWKGQRVLPRRVSCHSGHLSWPSLAHSASKPWQVKDMPFKSQHRWKNIKTVLKHGKKCVSCRTRHGFQNFFALKSIFLLHVSHTHICVCVYISFSLATLFLKLYFYFLERKSDRQIFYPWVHIPNAHQQLTWNWAKARKPEFGPGLPRRKLRTWTSPDA